MRVAVGGVLNRTDVFSASFAACNCDGVDASGSGDGSQNSSSWTPPTPLVRAVVLGGPPTAAVTTSCRVEAAAGRSWCTVNVLYVGTAAHAGATFPLCVVARATTVADLADRGVGAVLLDGRDDDMADSSSAFTSCWQIAVGPAPLSLATTESFPGECATETDCDLRIAPPNTCAIQAAALTDGVEVVSPPAPPLFNFSMPSNSLDLPTLLAGRVWLPALLPLGTGWHLSCSLLASPTAAAATSWHVAAVASAGNLTAEQAAAAHALVEQLVSAAAGSVTPIGASMPFAGSVVGYGCGTSTCAAFSMSCTAADDPRSCNCTASVVAGASIGRHAAPLPVALGFEDDGVALVLVGALPPTLLDSVGPLLPLGQVSVLVAAAAGVGAAPETATSVTSIAVRDFDVAIAGAGGRSYVTWQATASPVVHSSTSDASLATFVAVLRSRGPGGAGTADTSVLQMASSLVRAGTGFRLEWGTVSAGTINTSAALTGAVYADANNATTMASTEMDGALLPLWLGCTFAGIPAALVEPQMAAVTAFSLPASTLPSDVATAASMRGVATSSMVSVYATTAFPSLTAGMTAGLFIAGSAVGALSDIIVTAMLSGGSYVTVAPRVSTLVENGSVLPVVVAELELDAVPADGAEVTLNMTINDASWPGLAVSVVSGTPDAAHSALCVVAYNAPAGLLDGRAECSRNTTVPAGVTVAVLLLLRDAYNNSVNATLLASPLPVLLVAFPDGTAETASWETALLVGVGAPTIVVLAAFVPTSTAGSLRAGGWWVESQ
jgi:hypothetical protein